MLLSLLIDTVRQTRISVRGAAKVVSGLPRIQPDDHALLKALIEASALRTVIDRRYPLAEIGEAFRYAETGHKQGHVLVLFDKGGDLPLHSHGGREN